MTSAPLSGSGSSQKLLGGSGIKIRVAVISVVILGAGALIDPRATQTPLTTPQERAAPLLEEQVQAREVTVPFRGVQDVVSRVRHHSVAIGLGDRPVPQTMRDFSEGSSTPAVDAFGVFVSDRHVLSHADALDGRSTVQIAAADDIVADASMVAFEPDSGLVLLQTQPTSRPQVELSSTTPSVGMLAVAVGRSGARDFAVPVFVTGASGDQYVLSGHESMRAGMAVFTLEGELFAITGAGGSTAIAVREVVKRLMARASAGERRGAVGLTFQTIDGTLARVLGEKGVLISDVIEGGPASEAGTSPGDVLLAVGDAAADSIDAAAMVLRAAPPGTPIRLRVVRAGRVRTIDVTPVTAYEVAALARGRVTVPTFPEARVLFSVSQLQSSGIPAAARVVTLNGRAVTSRAHAERLLRAANQPVLILLRLDGTQFFAAIEPSR